MSKRRLPDAVEERLDELLWHVAAELDPETEIEGPPEVRSERIRADVRRWMKARGVPRTRRAGPWVRAAAVVLAVGGLGAAGYWKGWLGPRSRAPQLESDAESWYVQVARAPDAPRPGECSSDSWYCVQARRTSSARDL